MIRKPKIDWCNIIYLYLYAGVERVYASTVYAYRAQCCHTANGMCALIHAYARVSWCEMGICLNKLMCRLNARTARELLAKCNICSVGKLFLSPIKLCERTRDRVWTNRNHAIEYIAEWNLIWFLSKLATHLIKVILKFLTSTCAKRTHTHKVHVPRARRRVIHHDAWDLNAKWKHVIISFARSFTAPAKTCNRWKSSKKYFHRMHTVRRYTYNTP